jgi:hypothetical protein
MKLSQVKNIIKESIKGLINEQAATAAQCATLSADPNFGHCCEDAVYGNNHQTWNTDAGCEAIQQTATQMGLTIPQIESCCPGGPTPIQGCPQCDPAHWPNMQGWINNWTSLPNFSSPNPNQPCQHICQKITIWEGHCPTAPPVQQNQLACKLQEAYNQYNIHNCVNSNAPAC